jgi:hypothetical protein
MAAARPMVEIGSRGAASRGARGMTMRLNRIDVFATVAVGIGVLAYVLWLADVAVPGLRSPRVVGAVVLGLGWLASAVAVVPNFDQLIQASKVYLAVTSALGLAALTAGVVVLVSASEPMLALLVSATVVMWVLATIRHVRAAQRAAAPTAGAQPVDSRELIRNR